MLAEGIEVTGANLDNGLLQIDLERPLAEPQVRTIEIRSGGKRTRKAITAEPIETEADSESVSDRADAEAS